MSAAAPVVSASGQYDAADADDAVIVVDAENEQPVQGVVAPDGLGSKRKAPGDAGADAAGPAGDGTVQVEHAWWVSRRRVSSWLDELCVICQEPFSIGDVGDKPAVVRIPVVFVTRKNACPCKNHHCCAQCVHQLLAASIRSSPHAFTHSAILAAFYAGSVSGTGPVIRSNASLISFSQIRCPTCRGDLGSMDFGSNGSNKLGVPCMPLPAVVISQEAYDLAWSELAFSKHVPYFKCPLCNVHTANLEQHYKQLCTQIKCPFVGCDYKGAQMQQHLEAHVTIRNVLKLVRTTSFDATGLQLLQMRLDAVRHQQAQVVPAAASDSTDDDE